MRKYILETKKRGSRAEHSFCYQASCIQPRYLEFYTIPNIGTTVPDQDFLHDKILHKLVKSNLEVLIRLPLSSSIKTELVLH
jgi:hypothetical protein